MKRLHVSLGVKDLEASVRFYSTLFGAEPSVRRADYAKWSLEDPRVNFSLSSCCGSGGVNHLGIETESGEELAEVAERMSAAGGPTRDEKGVHCCYAQSDKAWASDPQGIAWEAFHSFKPAEPGDNRAAACCA